MPKIRVHKVHNSDDSDSDDFEPMPRAGKRKSMDIRNMKLAAEASKYVTNPDSEVFYWK